MQYRWHAYFGADVKVYRSYRRGDGTYVGIERDPGIAVMAPAWVLDVTVCGLMTLGSPQVSTAGLLDLSATLTSHGFRRSFDEIDSSKEAEHDHSQNKQSGAIVSSISSCQGRRKTGLKSRTTSPLTLDLLPHSDGVPMGHIVLVIENDEDVLFGTTLWLEQNGASVLPAHSTKEAMQFVTDMGMPPDIILADYQLDDGDTGVNAIRKIREMTQAHVAAILITADRSESLRSAGLRHDISVMTKPVKLSRLRPLIVWKVRRGMTGQSIDIDKSRR